MTRFALHIAFIALIALAGCKEEPTAPDLGLAGFDPHLIENQRAACIEDGGRFGKGGLSGGMVCFRTPSDANQGCSKSSDCEGDCLARSRSCSPIKPLFGCNEVLTVFGAPLNSLH